MRAQTNRRGEDCSQMERSRPLSVMGVGNGHQSCTHDLKMPLAMMSSDGTAIPGSFTTPIIGNSSLPGLLGLNSLTNQNAVLDLSKMQLHMCGNSGCVITPGSGSHTFNLEISPSGHLILPCCEYEQLDSQAQPLHTEPMSYPATIIPPLGGALMRGTKGTKGPKAVKHHVAAERPSSSSDEAASGSVKSPEQVQEKKRNRILNDRLHQDGNDSDRH